MSSKGLPLHCQGYTRPGNIREPSFKIAYETDLRKHPVSEAGNHSDYQPFIRTVRQHLRKSCKKMAGQTAFAGIQVGRQQRPKSLKGLLSTPCQKSTFRKPSAGNAEIQSPESMSSILNITPLHTAASSSAEIRRSPPPWAMRVLRSFFIVMTLRQSVSDMP